jgi:hypothetical protein
MRAQLMQIWVISRNDVASMRGVDYVGTRCDFSPTEFPDAVNNLIVANGGVNAKSLWLNNISVYKHVPNLDL